MFRKSSANLLVIAVLSTCLAGCFSRSVSEKVVEVPVTRDVVVHDNSNSGVVVERTDSDGNIIRERRKITVTERRF